MTKFIEFVDIKRLPASDSYSYQDDTIYNENDKISTYSSTSYSDVRKIINKLDLSQTTRILTSGSTPCQKQFKESSFVSPTTKILRLSNDNTPVDAQASLVPNSADLLIQTPDFAGQIEFLMLDKNCKQVEYNSEDDSDKSPNSLTSFTSFTRPTSLLLN